jgi:hypothetical protein
MARWRCGAVGLALGLALGLAMGAAQAQQSETEAAPAQPPPQLVGLEEPAAPQALNLARRAAVADGLSTYLALAAGAVERNPLVNPSPGGLVLFTGLKMGLLEAVSASSMETPHKAFALRALSALWGGASVNNLMLALAASGPVAVVAGVAGGWWVWARGTGASPSGPAPGQALAAAEQQTVTIADIADSAGRPTGQEQGHNTPSARCCAQQGIAQQGFPTGAGLGIK